MYPGWFLGGFFQIMTCFWKSPIDIPLFCFKLVLVFQKIGGLISNTPLGYTLVVCFSLTPKTFLKIPAAHSLLDRVLTAKNYVKLPEKSQQKWQNRQNLTTNEKSKTSKNDSTKRLKIVSNQKILIIPLSFQTSETRKIIQMKNIFDQISSKGLNFDQEERGVFYLILESKRKINLIYFWDSCAYESAPTLLKSKPLFCNCL